MERKCSSHVRYLSSILYEPPLLGQEKGTANYGILGLLYRYISDREGQAKLLRFIDRKIGT